MESIGAVLGAIKMYLLVGLVVTAIHAVAIRPPEGDTRWQRAVTVMEDVVSWPRLFVEASRMTGAPRADYQPLRSSMFHGPERNGGVSR